MVCIVSPHVDYRFDIYHHWRCGYVQKTKKFAIMLSLVFVWNMNYLVMDQGIRNLGFGVSKFWSSTKCRRTSNNHLQIPMAKYWKKNFLWMLCSTHLDTRNHHAKVWIYRIFDRSCGSFIRIEITNMIAPKIYCRDLISGWFSSFHAQSFNLDQ